MSLMFLKQHNLFSDSQFAYTKGVSTETALHTLVNDVLLNMNKGNMSVTCMLDLSKVFETVCHEILFYKLQNYRIHGHMLKWFKSYLGNRTQFVKDNNVKSNVRNIHIGLPQGTILGPILFLIYVNDFSYCFTDCKCVIYADDTTIFFL